MNNKNFQQVIDTTPRSSPLAPSVLPGARLKPGRTGRLFIGVLGLGAALGLAAPAWAQGVSGPTAAPSSSASWVDGWDFSLRYGRARESDVHKYGLIAGYKRPAPLWQGEVWSIHLRHEIEAAGWHVPRAKNIAELGYTPMFRL